MLRITPIKCFKDNYAYLLSTLKTSILIDPAQKDRVTPFVEKLDAVFCTHHHTDHSAGNIYFRDRFKVDVYGGDDRIPGQTIQVTDNQIIQVGDINVHCISTPCHTSGHFCYFIHYGNDTPVVFTGDTLFIGGCGRFFEGDAAGMFNSLTKLKKLDKETLVYCGHEYTMQNLSFAIGVDPENEDLKSYYNSVKDLQVTIPSSIGNELSINPFMRTDILTKRTGSKDEVECMNLLRELKNKF